VKKHFTLLVGISLGILILAPLLPLLLWSVAKHWFPPALFPGAFSLRGFEALFSSGALEALWHSVWIGCLAASISVVIAYPAGRSLAFSKHPLRPLFQGALLLPALAPQMATALGLHTRFIKLGLEDSPFGVVLAHLIPALPYAIVVMSAGFSNYDSRFEEAAMNLGASRLKTLWRITLPQLIPSIAVAFLFAFLISWSQYTLTLVIGGGVVITLPILVYSMASAGDFHLIASTCIAFVAPVLLLTPFIDHALLGGVKKKDQPLKEVFR